MDNLPGALNALHATYLDDQDTMPETWKNWIEEAGGTDGTTAAVGYPYKVAGVISISGALARASFLDNEHVPFLTVHDTGDPQIPFNTGTTIWHYKFTYDRWKQCTAS